MMKEITKPNQPVVTEPKYEKQVSPIVLKLVPYLKKLGTRFENMKPAEDKYISAFIAYWSKLYDDLGYPNLESDLLEVFSYYVNWLHAEKYDFLNHEARSPISYIFQLENIDENNGIRSISAFRHFLTTVLKTEWLRTYKTAFERFWQAMHGKHFVPDTSAKDRDSVLEMVVSTYHPMQSPYNLIRAFYSMRSAVNTCDKKLEPYYWDAACQLSDALFSVIDAAIMGTCEPNKGYELLAVQLKNDIANHSTDPVLDKFCSEYGRMEHLQDRLDGKPMQVELPMQHNISVDEREPTTERGKRMAAIFSDQWVANDTLSDYERTLPEKSREAQIKHQTEETFTAEDWNAE
jgi:urease accessory protein UreF